MNAERWQKLGKLFDVALQQTPADRAAYVVEVCRDDHDMRDELQAMLEHHDQANSYLESPAYAVAVDDGNLFEDPVAALAGKSIGQYQIDSIIGEGGMGVVYLAFDRELQRKIALKFLHDDILNDKQRVQRFKQEARAASALNHPNILTIHQIGEIDGHQFIATEFVQGDTLREIIKRGKLSTNQTIEIAIQIASALAAAHAADIIHRDIKPENIIVRPDGYVKVLDFGLAKLIEASPGSSEASTLLNTDQGTIVGTLQYMSPEQMRGQPLDARTDIWSFGVVVYEMLTNHPPFAGDTRSDVIAAILEREPSPLTNYLATTPIQLQSLITSALQKNRERRFESANNLVTHLRLLRDSMYADAAAVTESDRPSFAHRQTIRTNEHAGGSTLPIFSAEYFVAEIKHHKLAAAFVSLAMLITVVGLGLYFMKLRRVSPAQSSRTPTITKITTSGKVKDAAVSPDGKYIVYVLEEKGAGSFWLRQVGTTTDVQIAPAGDFGRLTISPDNTQIYYKNFFNTLYEFPILGGPRKLVLEHVYSPISFSPDGKQFAFVRYTAPGEGALMIANSDGSNERTLITRKQPERFLNDGPAWSPDSRTVACAIAGTDTKGDYTELIAVDVNSKGQESIVSQRTFWINKVLWLPDESGLLAVANDYSSWYQQIWQLSYPGGVVRKITNDFDSYDDISMSADATRLVAVRQNENLNIEVTANGHIERLTSITSEAGGYDTLSWAPNDQLLYASNSGGSLDIWSIGTNQTNARQLTLNAGTNYAPNVSPDGRYIVFTSYRDATKKTNIWRMDADGGNQKQLTTGGDDSSPVCTPDGKFVIYLHEVFYHDDPTLWKIPTLWRVPIEGGDAVQISNKFVWAPQVSPDGKSIACNYNDGPPTLDKDKWKIAVFSIDGGEALKTFDIPAHPFWDAPGVKWTIDGKALTYRRSQDGTDNLWTQPLDGTAKQLTHFTSGEIRSFAWSRDGRLAISRGIETSDVVMMGNFR